MPKLLRQLILVLLGLGVLTFVVLALWPKPVEVDLAIVDTGPLIVTVDEDGMTRIREKYLVSAPLAGRLSRVTLKQGDAVTAAETILAAIDPPDPSLLDPRAQAESRARIEAAEANLDRAAAEVARSAALLELAQTELNRTRDASTRGAATNKELDDANAMAIMRSQEVRSAEFSREVARFELELARAAMLHSSGQGESSEGRFEIRAPISGRVLRVLQESTAVVQAGTPLIEVGDPTDLEVVVDVLSRDAVTIRSGARVVLEHWGGDQPLHGRVRIVEPAAFTKISALGVEEQRVNIVIDLTDPLELRAGLGDSYRVEAGIVVWEEQDVLKVPTGALFRHAQSWAVFALEDGAAVMRDVTIGRRSSTEAQVLSGLQRSDRVVLFPSDRVRQGARIQARAGR